MKTISFVIPVYNEARRLHKTFTALDGLVLPHGLQLKEVVFVNDGSTDSTLQKIKTYTLLRKKTDLITVLSYKQNQGKGYALKLGMLHTTSDYTLFFDADMSTPLSELQKFMPAITLGTSVIVGTRKNGKSTVIIHQPALREWLGRCFTRLTRFVLRIRVTDFTCGFKAFSKRAKDLIFAEGVVDRWGYDAEVLFLAYQHNLSTTEVPVKWSNDAHTKVHILKAIPQTLFELCLIRYTHSVRPLFSSLFATIVSRASI